VYLFFNNQFYPDSTPLFVADNRAYRYGEGFFETMLFSNGQLCFAKEHLERLSGGMAITGINPPTHFNQAYLEEIATELVKKNNLSPAARIRISVTAGNGMLHQANPDGFELLLESFALADLPATLNKEGWTTGLFTHAHKNNDALASYKTASHLVYALAARHAAANNWNDAIVLNNQGHVCDTSIANIFLVSGNDIITPPLNSGCIAGVMRRNIMQWLQKNGYPILEREMLPAELETADELFVTNAIQGIRWVKSFGNRNYQHQMVPEIAKKLLADCYHEK
jgi:branched-chain amino acid aminotransferase